MNSHIHEDHDDSPLSVPDADGSMTLGTEPDNPAMDDALRRAELQRRVEALEREKAERTRAELRKWAETLEKEIQAYRKWRSDLRWRRLKRMAFVTGVFILLFHNSVGSPLFWILLAVAGIVAAEEPSGKKRQEMATALARTRDPSATAILAKAYLNGDKDTREVAAQGLKSMLPTLRASDREHIGDEGMEALLELLKRPREVEVLIAALKGLEQVGDENALPVVEELAKLKPSSRQFLQGRVQTNIMMVGLTVTGLTREDWERLQVAIYECYQYLRPRAEQARLRTTLLRATTNPDAPAETLLRPAGGASTTPAEQLLRPSGD